MERDSPWAQEAASILKAELVRRRVDYSALSVRLAGIGVTENARQLAVKINRGTFSFAFLLKVLKALDIDTIHVRR